MVTLSGQEEVAVAGQAKIVSCLDYGIIDKNFIRDAFNQSPIDALKRKKAEPKSFDTRSKDVLSVFWTVFSLGKGHSRIRLEIFTLFSLFKECRLEMKAQDIKTLEKMFRTCSQSVSLAHQEGSISDDEMKEIVKELGVVREAIDEATAHRQMPVCNQKIPSMGIYEAKISNPIAPPKNVKLPTANSVANPRSPHLVPPKDVAARAAVPSVLKLDPGMPILEKLQTLVETNASSQQIVQELYQMDFSPYLDWSKNKYIPEVDQANEWAKFSVQESHLIMESLNTLTQRLVDFSVKEQELPIDMFEVITKMSCMVAFLTHHTIHHGNFSDESFRLVDQVLFFQKMLASASCITYYRYGHCIHAGNVKTNQQMLNFMHQMEGFHRAYPEHKQKKYHERFDEQEFVKGKGSLLNQINILGYLDTQVKYLLHLLPNYYQSSGNLLKGTGGLPSSIYNWIAPLPLPLLSVYHSVRIQPLHTSSPSIKTKDGAWKGSSYRDTPEAIQHDPDSTLADFEAALRNSDLWSWREKGEKELKKSSPREKQLKTLLKKQEEYLLRASQMGMPFSKEERTALMCLLRMEKPQRELIGFMEAHSSLLSHPSVRSWVQLLFFHPVLLETLRWDHEGFCQIMPTFLAEKIAETMTKGNIEVLLSLIQMSERLRGIYDVLKLDTRQFFKIGAAELETLLEESRKKDLGGQASSEVIAMQLKILFAKETLSQQELSQIIINMHDLQKSVAKASAFDYRELFWIKGRYQDLLDGLILDQDHLDHVLDTLCHKNGLLLDDSAWTGEFPVFSNAQYRIDLKTGTITDLVSESIATALPATLLAHYKKIIPENVKAMKVEFFGTTIYFFHPYRVEEKEGSYTLYRSFNGKMLQAADFLGSFPLEQSLYIDPEDPSKGYFVNEEHEILFEARLKNGKVASVIDLRGVKPTDPMQLIALDALPEGALQQLANIEDPRHILAWGRNTVETIEFPRYGLKFTIEGDALVCQSPEYAGYRVLAQEKKEFPFSLVLEHPSGAKKLLIPEGRAIISGQIPQFPYYGLAYIIWCIQNLISMWRFKTINMPSIVPCQRIESANPRLIAIDLRRHTEEFIFSNAGQSQELVLQALKVGNEELALRYIHITKDEKKWVQFLDNCLENGYAAAVGLSIAQKLHAALQGQKKQQALIAKLRAKEERLFAKYLQVAHKLTAPLRLPKSAFDRIADAMKKSSPLYYERHIAPFFMNIGDQFAIREHVNPEFIPVKNPEVMENTEIQKLEEVIQKANPLFSKKLNLLPEAISLKLNGDKLSAKKALQSLLHTANDPLEQLAIYAGQKQIPTLPDLTLALLQNDFESLKDQLPKETDLEQLKESLIHVFDHEVNHAAYQRQYDAKEHPELLAFELLNNVTFRNTQLEFLQKLVQETSSIVQAGTGSGKSSVLSVLRGFLRANGSNLVTQKVLPHLYQETVAILQSRLGHLKRKLYPFLFNQSMPLYDKEGNSLFAEIYQRMLETILAKGVVLTDYKSYPLLEQKFFSLSKQLMANWKHGVESDQILITHWHYLRKILILIETRDDQLMDEFDGPLSAVQRIQTQMREGPLFERWKLTESLAFYEILLQDPDLLLERNLQGAIPAHVRQECIQRAARHFAKMRARAEATPERLYTYLLGDSEEVLAYIDNWTLEEKDALAFAKDQFTLYLPLTLSRLSISHYARGKDGKKIVTCVKGERKEAKFGNPTEEINYAIQDYLQNKIALPVFRAWMIASKKDWETSPDAASQRFNDLLPGVSLTELAYLTPDDFEDRTLALLNLANSRPEAVQFFLKRHLESLRTSGIVISMNPQDCVAMSPAVSGISATSGSLGSLHNQFAIDLKAADDLRLKMALRLKTRSLRNPLRYDPLSPLEVLKQIKHPQFCAIIDGNAAFQSIPPEQVALALLQANPKLKRVEYYDKDGFQNFVGSPTATLVEKGFYFPEAYTRGSDQLLNPHGVALMTAGNNGDLEDFIQEEGRMRGHEQKVLVALSSFTPPEVITLDDLLAQKEANRQEACKADRYPAELQRLKQMMRHSAREELLKIDELVPFFQRFEQLESLFIQSISAAETLPGDYFQKHCRLVHKNAHPVQELQAFQKTLIQRSQELNIPSEHLEAYDATNLGAHMPDTVFPLQMAEEQQLEVQEELEVNNAFEVELELEQHQEHQVIPNKVEAYLPREFTEAVSLTADHLHPAFDRDLRLTMSYLPLDRRDPLHIRTPFDDRTQRVGTVLVILEAKDVYPFTKNLHSVIIGDLLDDVDITSTLIRHYDRHFFYDIRLNRPTSSLFDVQNILQSPRFISLIAQTKFLDGMIDGYTNAELQSLGVWLRDKDAAKMFRFFKDTILKYRPEQKFEHSQLWNLFNDL